MDPKEFAAPAAEYRGVTLWMLNDRLETDQVLEQLAGFRRAGWGAVIGRTFNGLLTEYLSDEWMAMTDALVARAGELGLRVWLQAGYMPSAVPDLPESIQYKGLARRPVDQPPESGETVLAEADGVAYVKRSMASVLDLLNGEAVTDYLNRAYKDPYGGRYGDQFGKTIEAVWVDEPHFRPRLLPWSDRIAELFAEQWGYDLTEHLPELYEPIGDYPRTRHNYWRTVLGMFLDAYFAAVGDWCGEHEVKFSGHLMGEDTLDSQVAWTGAAMPCYEYMQLPGIDHLTLSLQWPTGVKRFILPPKQVSSVAAQLGKREVLAEMYAVSSHRITFAERKRIAEWMAVLGVNYRCMHASFYSMRGRRKRIYVPHLSYQQPWWPDNRLAADYFARVSYALRQGVADVDVLVLHPEESAFCLYDPRRREQPHDRRHEPDDLRTMDDELVKLCENLLAVHRDFHFGDETILARHGEVRGARLHVGEMDYKVVVAPSLVTIRRSTMELLTRFAAAGGKVLTVGAFPGRVDGAVVEMLTGTLHEGLETSLNELRLAVEPVDNTPEALKCALDHAAVESVDVVADDPSGGAADVWVQSRRVGDDRMVYLVNTSAEHRMDGRLKIRGHGKVTDWDLRTGLVAPAAQQTENGFIFVPLALEPLGAKLLMFQPNEPAADVEAVKPVVTRRIPLAEKLRIHRDRPNALTLDVCRLRRGDGEFGEAKPVLTWQKLLEADGYAGPVTLRFDFHVTDKPAELCAVVEDADKLHLAVNGRPAAYAGLEYYVDRSFLPVDIAEHVVVGENTLDVTVDFRPVPKATFALASLYEVHEGTELEAVYLIGDFAVAATVSDGEPADKCVRLAPAFSLAAEPAVADGADLTAAGYPFFAGRIILADTVTLDAPAEGERVFLRLDGLDAVLAKVRVNGAAAGEILWAPYEVDITDRIVGGANEIEIELVSSLRNLLGPHHRTTGEPDDCWRTAFDDNRSVDTFEHREEALASWTDDYFCIHLGLPGRAAVVYRRHA